MKFEKIYEFKAAKDGINDLLLDDYLYSCGEDDFIRKWNILNYSLICEVKAHDKDINGIVLSPSKNSIISYSDDGKIREFNLDLKPLYDYKGHNSRVNDLAFIDQKRFITASDDGTTRLYINRGSYKEKDFEIGDVESVCVFKDKILIGGSKLVICDFDLNKLTSYDDDYTYGIDGIYSDGNLIYISRSMEKKLEIRDERFNILKILKMPSWINFIDFKYGYIFMAVSNMILVYDKDMNEILRNDFSDAEISSFVFYDKNMIVGYDDSYIRVWSLNE